MINIQDIGQKCKEYRLEQGLYQHHVAADTGYSIENVSSFERGRNDNARIMLWYILHGMPIDRLKASDDNDG